MPENDLQIIYSKNTLLVLAGSSYSVDIIYAKYTKIFSLSKAKKTRSEA